jgi:hypothetical protein
MDGEKPHPLSILPRPTRIPPPPVVAPTAPPAQRSADKHVATTADAAAAPRARRPGNTTTTTPIVFTSFDAASGTPAPVFRASSRTTSHSPVPHCSPPHNMEHGELSSRHPIDALEGQGSPPVPMRPQPAHAPQDGGVHSGSAEPQATFHAQQHPQRAPAETGEATSCGRGSMGRPAKAPVLDSASSPPRSPWLETAQRSSLDLLGVSCQSGLGARVGGRQEGTSPTGAAPVSEEVAALAEARIHEGRRTAEARLGSLQNYAVMIARSLSASIMRCSVPSCKFAHFVSLPQPSRGFQDCFLGIAVNGW